MANIVKTAKGASLDFNQLMLNNEHVIAVGNAGVNARGDIVERGRVVKTREQVMQETYNIRGANVIQDAKSKIRTSASAIAADKIDPPVIDTPVAAPIVAPVVEPIVAAVVENNTIASSIENSVVADKLEEVNEIKPRGGLADAINRSKEISDKLDEKRKRI